MKIGISLGPKTELVEEVPEEFDFAEIGIGEMETATFEIFSPDYDYHTVSREKFLQHF